MRVYIGIGLLSVVHAHYKDKVDDWRLAVICLLWPLYLFILLVEWLRDNIANQEPFF